MLHAHTTYITCSLKSSMLLLCKSLLLGRTFFQSIVTCYQQQQQQQVLALKVLKLQVMSFSCW